MVLLPCLVIFVDQTECSIRHWFTHIHNPSGDKFRSNMLPTIPRLLSLRKNCGCEDLIQYFHQSFRESKIQTLLLGWCNNFYDFFAWEHRNYSMLFCNWRLQDFYEGFWPKRTVLGSLWLQNSDGFHTILVQICTMFKQISWFETQKSSHKRR